MPSFPGGSPGGQWLTLDNRALRGYAVFTTTHAEIIIADNNLLTIETAMEPSRAWSQLPWQQAILMLDGTSKR